MLAFYHLCNPCWRIWNRTKIAEVKARLPTIRRLSSFPSQTRTAIFRFRVERPTIRRTGSRRQCNRNTFLFKGNPVLSRDGQRPCCYTFFIRKFTGTSERTCTSNAEASVSKTDVFSVSPHSCMSMRNRTSISGFEDQCTIHCAINTISVVASS